MEQIGDGILTLLIIGAHVSIHVHDITMLIKTAVHIASFVFVHVYLCLEFETLILQN